MMAMLGWWQSCLCACWCLVDGLPSICLPGLPAWAHEICTRGCNLANFHRAPTLSTRFARPNAERLPSSRPQVHPIRAHETALRTGTVWLSIAQSAGAARSADTQEERRARVFSNGGGGRSSSGSSSSCSCSSISSNNFVGSRWAWRKAADDRLHEATGTWARPSGIDHDPSDSAARHHGTDDDDGTDGTNGALTTIMLRVIAKSSRLLRDGPGTTQIVVAAPVVSEPAFSDSSSVLFLLWAPMPTARNLQLLLSPKLHAIVRFACIITATIVGIVVIITPHRSNLRFGPDDLPGRGPIFVARARAPSLDCVSLRRPVARLPGVIISRCLVAVPCARHLLPGGTYVPVSKGARDLVLGQMPLLLGSHPLRLLRRPGTHMCPPSLVAPVTYLTLCFTFACSGPCSHRACSHLQERHCALVRALGQGAAA
jgi:hypothetical protein